MIWDIIVFGILVALYIAGLIAFLLKIGPYRRLDKRKLRACIITYIAGALAIIYLTVNLVRVLRGY